MNIRSGVAQADIGLLLEGTFPYVRGGVSSWVYQIIRGFPELTFAICFLGSRKEDYGDVQYILPENVVHLESHYLHDKGSNPPVSECPGNEEAFAVVRALHDEYREKKIDLERQYLGQIVGFEREGQYGEREFLYSRESWDYITELYRKNCTDPSLIDYFWTVRTMHSPLWRLMGIADNFVPCRAYHTICTGYAGFLGALLKKSTGKPLLLSEHGIYTKERKIDLFQAEWITDTRGELEKGTSEVAYFRELWVRFFEALGWECYDSADRIISLYEANRQRQLSDGAREEKTLCIPNGIDLPHLDMLRAQRPKDIPLVVCLIGRVVPIKDVKTFIRAMRTVVNAMPGVQAWVAGPEEEDQAYAQECHSLAEGLGDSVRFLGFQKIDDILPRVGLLALSSISEALPLVILEGFAAGVPCVATDVGSCRQLIEGGDAQDKALGKAGAIVGIANPEALAEAIITLLADPARWRAAQQAGLKRVGRYYTQEHMFAQYREVYRQALQTDAVSTAAPPASTARCLWQA
jgi:glycosyltransferase involved in cell wall biosynthesis